MKRLVVLVALLSLLASLSPLNIVDAGASVMDTSILDNDISAGASETDNPDSATGTITIMICAVAEE